MLNKQIVVSRSSLANIEKGRHQCSVYVLYQIAHALSIEVISLLPSKEDVFGVNESVTTIDYVIDSERLSKSDAKKLEKYIKSFK